MKKQLKISLFEQFGETLNTREAVASLFEKIKTEAVTSVTLDFSYVTFVSRSFTDQLIKEKLSLSEKVDFIFLNADDNVLRMLREVKKTQNLKKRVYKQIPVFKFSSKSKLDEYLISI